MCTLTYLPLANNQFIITTNRDESTVRPSAITPQISQRKTGNILCPIDGKAKGTWIATAETGITACLLNGAFEKHNPTGNYRMSRGRVVMEIFDYEEVEAFIEEYKLEDIEPFTLVLLEKKQNLSLTELRWDGSQKYIKTLDTTVPHLWASATLYPPEVIAKRKQWFAEWLTKDLAFTQENILHFHKSAGEGDPENDLVMQRGQVLRTVSITSVLSEDTTDHMYYEDMMSQQRITKTLQRKVPQIVNQK